MPQACGVDFQQSAIVSETTVQDTVFSIGHSTHSQERFIGLLRQHGITALCDVRSTPYSRMNSQFNREELEKALLAQGIEYRFLGKELGARSDDPRCYEAGKVQYDRLAETTLFKYGLKRVLKGMKEGFRIVLMCAEKEPIECHRTILVARHLAALEIDVAHIHADGCLETHDAALSRLARLMNLPEHDMFHSHEELLANVYRKQGERIAYEIADPDSVIVKDLAG
ncbi:MAG TPA: DUF488 domain-containing protein [Terriglobales bacterium]|nr:DUF488 domain-containing protein [Terriglobales bacterium]